MLQIGNGFRKCRSLAMLRGPAPVERGLKKFAASDGGSIDLCAVLSIKCQPKQALSKLIARKRTSTEPLFGSIWQASRGNKRGHQRWNLASGGHLSVTRGRAARNITDVAVSLHRPELMPWLTNYCWFRPRILQMLGYGSVFAQVLRCAIESAECSIG